MKAQQFWERCCQVKKIDPAIAYEAWSFGGDPDGLAELVYKGIKTATASGYDLYALDGEELPEAGEYSVILDSREKPVCVIRTTRVYTVPYCEVTAEHAFREGEGDRSLAYWRRVHWDFFTKDFASYGLTFTESRLIVCEEFEVIYRWEETT